jgi:hypothetical protein
MQVVELTSALRFRARLARLQLGMGDDDSFGSRELAGPMATVALLLAFDLPSRLTTFRGGCCCTAWTITTPQKVANRLE